MIRRTIRRWWCGRALCPWQRMRRGYSDQDLWNFDTYLAGVLTKALPDLANGAGYQPLNAQYEYDPDADATYWTQLLNEMAEGFHLNATQWEWDIDDGAEEKWAKVNRSWELLAQWHGALWD